MSNTITAMYARKNFGQILDKAFLLKKRFIIERAGKPMAEIVPYNSHSDSVDCAALEKAVEKLLKRIKEPKSKKLQKAIDDVIKVMEGGQGDG